MFAQAHASAMNIFKMQRADFVLLFVPREPSSCVLVCASSLSVTRTQALMQ